MTNQNQALQALSPSEVIDLLQQQLYQQIQLNQSYQIDEAMDLAQSTAELADYIKKHQLLDRPEFADQSKNIKSLYAQLEITIDAARQEISDKLQEISVAKKTLNAYRHST